VVAVVVVAVVVVVVVDRNAATRTSNVSATHA
jgi:hypothetical protein